MDSNPHNITDLVVNMSGRNSSTTVYKQNYISAITPTMQEQNPHSTVDSSDVDLFSKLMNVWWDPDGAMKMLHKMNSGRVPFVRDGLVSCSNAERVLLPLKDKKILDVGCGGGILSEALARLGATVTGVDASSELISVAEAHKDVDPRIANNKPTYFCTTIEEHSQANCNYYDGVVASEVIEHVNNQDLFVKCCVHTLKPGGKIFFTTPNKTRASQFVIIFLAETLLGLVPRGAHQYEKFVHSNKLTFMLERNNCHVEQIHGLIFNPLTRRWVLSKHHHLIYALQAVKLDQH